MGKISLYDPVPRCLLEKQNLDTTVVFTALFSIVLLVCTAPFIPDIWFEIGSTPACVLTVTFFTAGFAILAASKAKMFEMRGHMQFNFLIYIAWCSAEAIIISLIYTFATIEGCKHGWIRIVHDETELIFLGAIVFCIVMIGIPYVLSGMYFTIDEKDNTIRLINYGNVVSDMEPTPLEDKRITLFDNNGSLKFSVKSSNLYYIESDDNYIKTWYTDSSGELKTYMVRCKLKTVEESFAGSELVRCHRKYMINMDKVRLLTSEKEGYFVQLDSDKIFRIPISKTYEEKILSIFNSR